MFLYQFLFFLERNKCNWDYCNYVLGFNFQEVRNGCFRKRSNFEKLVLVASYTRLLGTESWLEWVWGLTQVFRKTSFIADYDVCGFRATLSIRIHIGFAIPNSRRADFILERSTRSSLEHELITILFFFLFSLPIFEIPIFL